MHKHSKCVGLLCLFICVIGDRVSCLSVVCVCVLCMFVLGGDVRVRLLCVVVLSQLMCFWY